MFSDPNTREVPWIYLGKSTVLGVASHTSFSIFDTVSDVFSVWSPTGCARHDTHTMSCSESIFIPRYLLCDCIFLDG